MDRTAFMKKCLANNVYIMSYTGTVDGAPQGERYYGISTVHSGDDLGDEFRLDGTELYGDLTKVKRVATTEEAALEQYIEYYKQTTTL